MLTVASPSVPDMEIELRARGVREAIEKARDGETDRARVRTVLLSRIASRPPSFSGHLRSSPIRRSGMASRAMSVRYPWVAAPESILRPRSRTRRFALMAQQFIEKRLQEYDFHPDAWGPIIIRDPQRPRNASRKWRAIVTPIGSWMTITDLIQRTLQRVPDVAKVQRAGVLPRRDLPGVLATTGLPRSRCSRRRSKTSWMRGTSLLPADMVQTQSRNVLIDATAEFKSTKEIGNVLVGASPTGVPVYLRDLVDMSRGYQTPDTVLELHDLSRCERQLASQPCHHPGRADALGRADLQVRRSGRQGACHRAPATACRPDSLRAPRTSRSKCRNLSVC